MYCDSNVSLGFLCRVNGTQYGTQQDDDFILSMEGLSRYFRMGDRIARRYNEGVKRIHLTMVIVASTFMY